MKNTNLFILIVSFIISTSCSDDDNTNVTLDPEFSVEINGNAFNAEFKEAFLSNGVLSIQASDNNGNNTFLINVKNPSETTYTTGNTDFSLIPEMSFQPSPSQLTAMANPNESSAGSVSITNFDTTNNSVSGTFNFSGTSPFFPATNEYTNGVFTDIPVSNTEPEIQANGSLDFDLDGENFVPSNLFVNRLVLSEVGNDAIHLIIKKPGSPTFILQFPTNTPTGEFTPGPLTNYNIQANLDSPTQIGPTNNATLTILENDMDSNHITGTFEAVLDNDFTAGNDPSEFTITNGQFDIFYREF